jgi:hypothetical protein
VNEAPTDVALSANTVAEKATGAVVGAVTVADPDAGDLPTVAVSDNRFEIVGGQLKLRPGQALDFESEGTVNLNITATDAGGLSLTQAFTVVVTNVNEAPERITLTPRVVAENVSGAMVGTLSAVDPEGDQVRFAVTDPRWEVDGTTLKLKAGHSVQRPESPTVEVQVTAMDSGQPALSGTATMVIIVTANPFPWQYQPQAFDVDTDGVIAAADVLVLIDEINNPTVRQADGSLPESRPVDSLLPYYDPDGDGRLFAKDVLAIIDYINNRTTTEGEGEAVAAPTPDDPALAPTGSAALATVSGSDAQNSRLAGNWLGRGEGSANTLRDAATWCAPSQIPAARLRTVTVAPPRSLAQLDGELPDIESLLDELAADVAAASGSALGG